MKYLVFRLYAPLVSWGEIAVGGERHSADHPGKSAVIGLIGASLGIGRDEGGENLALEESLGMGLKVISPGTILHDYHTTQVAREDKKMITCSRKESLATGDEINTILSNREYRTDSLAVVGLWERGGSFTSLEEIKRGMLNPAYHLYLGRKSCPPGFLLEPEVVEASTLKEGLDSNHFKESVFDFFFEEQKTLYYWEKHPEPGIEAVQMVPRNDQLISRERWQFRSRDEYMGFNAPGEG